MLVVVKNPIPSKYVNNTLAFANIKRWLVICACT